MSDPRNVVMVTFDSLRADHCGFMGYERETMPTLGRMADEGVVFENAMASAVPTIASMTSVMTGNYSLASPEVGFDAEQREQVTSQPTIAEVLSDAGYSTGAVSPNPPASSYFGFDQGFDMFEDFLGGDEGLLDRLWNGVFQRSMSGGGAARYLRLARNVVSREEVLRPWESYYDRIREWTERAEEPYFLWVLLLDTHHPWLIPREARQWCSRRDMLYSFPYYWRMLKSGWEPDFSTDERQRLIDLYDDSIRYADGFLERLERDLRDDDPVFVVFSDHGEEFGDNGRYGHEPYLSEALTRVPLVVYDAGRDDTVSRPVELRSVAPTVADVASVDHPFTARSLLDDGGRPWATSKVFTDGQRRVAIRTETHKFISDGGSERLYDLREDPAERTDVADSRPDAVAAFRQVLQRHVAGERERRSIRAAREPLTKGTHV